MALSKFCSLRWTLKAMADMQVALWSVYYCWQRGTNPTCGVSTRFARKREEDRLGDPRSLLAASRTQLRTHVHSTVPYLCGAGDILDHILVTYSHRPQCCTQLSLSYAQLSPSHGRMTATAAHTYSRGLTNALPVALEAVWRQ